jgi:Peptidase family M48
MTDEEIFDTETKNYTGGRCPYERLPTPVKSAYSEVVNRSNDLIAATRRALPELPTIHFDFIQNGTVNAWTFKAKDRYFIGLTTGALYMLRMVIGRMLADRGTFEFIGQPSLEADDLLPVLHYIPNADAMADQQTAILTPKCSVRASYAWFLQDQAIMFLVGHEIAHITRGHVDYLTTQGAGLTAPLEGNESSIERQCLEMDADRRSIMSRIDSLRVTYGKPERVLPPWSPDSYDAGQFIQDWSVSLNIVFRLFGDIQFSRSELNGLAYPPVPVRRALCEMWAYGFTKDIWDESLSEVVLKSLVDGHRYVEDAFAHILGESVRTPRPGPSYSKWSQKHMQRLVDHWNDTVRLQVESFSFEW